MSRESKLSLWSLPVVLGGVVCLASTQANAQTPALSSNVVARNDRVRPRFGIGYWFGVGGMPGFGLGALGLDIKLGVQMSDLFGAYLQVYGSSVIFSGVFGASLMTDYTFNNLVTVGAGLGVAFNYLSGFATSQSFTGSFGVPIRLGLNFGPDRPLEVSRHKFTLSFEGFFGAGMISSMGFAGYGGIGLSYQIM